MWSDEFNGPAGSSPDPTKWSLEEGGGIWGGGDELQDYTRRPSNVSLDGKGDLVITARKENYGGFPYTSARLETQGKFSFTYGRVEARMKLPEGQGIYPIFWLLGSNINEVGWPASGEIDVMESRGQYPFTFMGHIHGPEPGNLEPNADWGLGETVNSSSSLNNWNVYGVEWRANAVTFLFNGKPYTPTYTPAMLDNGQTWTLNHPFFLLLNLVVGGEFAGPPNEQTPFPAQMLVNWVRVYS